MPNASLIKRPKVTINVLEENIFKILKDHGVYLSAHVENILYTSGYTNALILSELTSNQLKDVVDVVRFQFGEKSIVDGMNTEEKIATFGKLYADKPHLFTFFPGELVSINIAVKVAQDIEEAASHKPKRKCIAR